MPAPRVLQRAEPAAAFKMLRVLVAPTNDVELAALRCAARCGLPTGGYARAGDYDARVLAPRGAHVRLPCPRAAVAVVCCPEPAPWARAWLHATFLRWRAEAAMHPRVRALRQRHAAPPGARRGGGGGGPGGENRPIAPGAAGRAGGGGRRGRAGCDNTVYSLRARRARGVSFSFTNFPAIASKLRLVNPARANMMLTTGQKPRASVRKKNSCTDANSTGTASRAAINIAAPDIMPCCNNAAAAIHFFR